MRVIVCGLFVTWLASVAGIAAEPSRPFIVAGYLPSYRFDVVNVDRAGILTDVILFSVSPNEDGTLADARLPTEVAGPLRDQLAAHGCRVLAAIGGWSRSKTFGRVTADDALRAKLVANLVSLCDRLKLDGIDVDWEFPRNDAERLQLAQFLTELRAALAPKKRLVTIAVAPWEQLAPATIAAVHRVHLMAYDNGGRHSTPEYADEGITKMLAAGVPPEKLCLGIPFYGRPYEGEFGKGVAYSEIVARHQPAADADEAAGLYFNSPGTVAAKVKLAQQRGIGGVMIWEIGQDVADPDRSLLESIGRAAARK